MLRVGPGATRCAAAGAVRSSMTVEPDTALPSVPLACVTTGQVTTSLAFGLRVGEVGQVECKHTGGGRSRN